MNSSPAAEGPAVKPLTYPTPDAATPSCPLAAFARFAAFGGGVGVLSSLAVPLLATLMPWTLSNALIIIASTVLATELHARYTFRTGRRADWRRHWQSAGSAAAAYAATSVAMFALHALQSSPSALTEQLVYLSASGLAGIGRFLILRLLFATGRDQETKPPGTTQTTTIFSPQPLTSPPAPTVATAGATVTAVATGTAIPRTTIARPRRTPARPTGLATALSPN
ncbi:GtrA family protein [Streptomyces canus]|uniref:GtrA family protein n=1 Tax=Streptomyces canus TaxID=58343 RepID=UPI0033CA78BD